MSDLRKAAEMALEVLSHSLGHSNEAQEQIDKTKQALRQALAQPEEKMRIEGNGKLTTKPYPDGYESEHQFRKALSQREWVGLTDEEGAEIWGDAHDIDWNRIVTPKEIIKRIEAKLKEKNT